MDSTVIGKLYILGGKLNHFSGFRCLRMVMPPNEEVPLPALDENNVRY